MSLLSMVCMGWRGIIAKFADLVSCSARLCFLDRIANAIRFFYFIIEYDSL